MRYGTEVTLKGSDAYTRSGFVLDRWCTDVDCVDPDGNYTPGQVITANNNMTLYAIWRPILQELSNSMDAGGLGIDARDSHMYFLDRYNGQYWLMNISIRGEVPSDGSNFSTPTTWNVAAGSLVAGNSYTEARSVIPGGVEHGMYNFCAISAGTSCNDTTNYTSGEDICPAGWSLPTADELLSAAPRLFDAGAFGSIGGSSTRV